jgi:hypothetical protein
MPTSATYLRRGAIGASSAGRLNSIVAARELPGTDWRADPAWRGLLRGVPLRNLGPEESRSYLTACGVDEAVHDRVVDVTHDHPLGLSLVADVIVGGGEASAGPRALELVATLPRRFVDVVPIGERRRALDACALSRVTTEAVLPWITSSTGPVRALVSITEAASVWRSSTFPRHPAGNQRRSSECTN